MAVEVIAVRGAPTIKTGFLLDQSVGAVRQLILFAHLVFDFAEQQPRVVVAIVQLAAVGIDATADQMQVISVFVARDLARLIAFGDEFSVGVVAEGAGDTSRQSGLDQPAENVPLILGDRTLCILTT